MILLGDGEKLSYNDVGKSFTGVALEISRSSRFKKQVRVQKFKITQLWSSSSGFYSNIVLIFSLSAITQLVTLAMPFFLQISIDSVLPSADVDLLLILAVGFSGLAIISSLSTWLRSQLLTNVGALITYQIVTNLFRHLLRLPLTWYEKRHSGDIISRFTSTQPISQFLSQGLPSSLIDALIILFTIVLMIIYSLTLTAIALAAIAILTIVRLLFLSKVRDLNVDLVGANARESSTFIETLRGIPSLKASGNEANRFERWQVQKTEALNAQLIFGRSTASFETLGQMVLAIEKVIFVYAAVSIVLKNEMTIGMIFAFQAYRQQFMDSAVRLVDQVIQFRMLDIHLGRLEDIALSDPEGEEEGYMGDVSSFQTIELRNLVISFGIDEAPVLKNVNISISRGDFVVLIGPSGGGKTTLLKVLMGLIAPSNGAVYIDGQNLQSIRHSWRRNLGAVLQDDVLFSGSFSENIASFEKSVDLRRVREAAGMAAIDTDIMRMPMRYDTLVGDMGSTLSGGQRQRMILARAIYKNPAVIFIDEGTAHLDAVSEGAVVQSLSSMSITRVVSAHRPQAIQGATRFFFVANGSVTEVYPDNGSRSESLEPSM